MKFGGSFSLKGTNANDYIKMMKKDGSKEQEKEQKEGGQEPVTPRVSSLAHSVNNKLFSKSLKKMTEEVGASGILHDLGVARPIRFTKEGSTFFLIFVHRPHNPLCRCRSLRRKPRY